MLTEKIFDLLIIGAGPSGLNAAFYGTICNLDVLLLEKNSVLGGQPIVLYPEKPVDDYPGILNQTAAEIVYKSIEQAKKSLRPEQIMTQTEVELVIFDDDNTITAVTNRSEIIKTKNLLISIGNGLFKPKLLPTTICEPKKNVLYKLENPQKLQNQEIIVLGGGDSAIDWTLTLHKLARKISIVHHSRQFKSQNRLTEQFQKLGINVFLDYQITAVGWIDYNKNFQSTHSQTTHNCLKIKRNGENFEENLFFNYLLVQYGFNHEKIVLPKGLEKLSTNNSNRIIVNAQMQTNLNRIYASGNICFYESKPNLIINACAEATIVINDIIKKRKSCTKI